MKKLNKQILRLAIPNIITNITIPLLGLVDLAIMGRLGSEIYIGAIALGGMIFNFIYWGFGFLRMGTSGFTAQAYGAGDRQEMVLVLARALLVAIMASVIVIALQRPIAWFSFLLIHGSEQVEVLAGEYFFIRIWAAPATIGIYALTGWFLGMQNARIPMIIAIAVNLVNIGFNILFVFGMGMTSDGVALGTVIAQYTGLIIASAFFFRKYSSLLAHLKRESLCQWRSFKRFFLVNKDIFIRTVCLIFTFSFFTARSASINDSVLAVNTLLLQFLFIFSYLVDGFAYAAEALVGKFIGAANQVQLLRSVKSLFRWGLAISIPFTIIYLIFGDRLLYLLTSNMDIIDLAHDYIFWVVAVPLVTFPAFLWDGIYIGATAAAQMRNTLLAATFVVFLPVYFISRHYIGNHGLWLAMMLFMAVRGMMLTLYARKAIFSKGQ